MGLHADAVHVSVFVKNGRVCTGTKDGWMQSKAKQDTERDEDVAVSLLRRNGDAAARPPLGSMMCSTL